MTVQEFEAQKTIHPCASCGRIGVVLALEPQNNASYIRCPHCGATKLAAWPHTGGIWLKRNLVKKPRKERPMGKGLYEVWDTYGNRCCHCSTSQADLILARIALQSHHVQPHATDGDAGFILPICEWCHADATNRQRTMRQMVARLHELHVEPLPPGSPRVSSAGVPPDPMRPAGQAPPGAVEGIPDDDADM